MHHSKTGRAASDFHVILDTLVGCPLHPNCGHMSDIAARQECATSGRTALQQKRGGKAVSCLPAFNRRKA